VLLAKLVHRFLESEHLKGIQGKRGMLLSYRETPSCYAMGRRWVSRTTRLRVACEGPSGWASWRRERHRSREFVAFLKKLDAAYPPATAIKLMLDNHSAHISKETNAWLAKQRDGRFTFVFTPKHGSSLNLVEGFFSKLARSVLRHIRVATKQQELRHRILAAIDNINRYPVIHSWTYRLNEAAW
jgi:transposase